MFSLILPFFGSVQAQPPTLSVQTNVLADANSAYLRMHQDDPVHWQLWSRDVLVEAQKADRPILISSGYYACHWCHVMQQENYRDPATAKRINRYFIPVKLDRELQTDLDDYLIEFSHRLTGRAGWPQHVLLTPQGYPFAAFGYLPNTELNLYLDRAAELWQTRRESITKLAKAATVKDASADTPVDTPERPYRTLESDFFKTLHSNIDMFSGGLLGSQKFPQTPLLIAALQALPTTSSNPQMEEIEAWFRLTLQRMQSEQLLDSVNGGFFRYTVDPEWQIPHFEKMAYDNAQLARLYFLADQRWPGQGFLQTANETMTYLETHLFNAKTGLFFGSQSALDQRGREGGRYLFDRPQLKQRLPQAAFETVQEAWRLDLPAPFEHGWLPSPTDHHWETIRQALRQPVESIPRDSKAVLSWNGLILHAYVTGYHTTRNPHYLDRAQKLSQALVNRLDQSRPPRAVGQEGQPIGHAILEDYAYTLKALHTLQAIAPNPSRQDQIEDLTKHALNDFLSPAGWQSNSVFRLPGQSRVAALPDQAQPSATAWLECLTPDRGRSRNLQTQARFEREPLNYASYLRVWRCQATKG